MNRLAFEKQVQVASALVDGLSIRGAERLLGVHRDTVMRFGVTLGDACARLHDTLVRDVRPARHTLDFISKSPEDVWQERVIRGQPSIQEAVARLSADERERLHQAVLAELKQHVHGGKVRLPSEAIYVSAVR